MIYQICNSILIINQYHLTKICTEVPMQLLKIIKVFERKLIGEVFRVYQDSIIFSEIVLVLDFND